MTTAPADPSDSSVLDTGSGSAVLLLHGTAPGTTAHGNFAELLPALAVYRTLAPDLLGFGNSAKPVDVDYGPELWARQAWQLLDERGIDQVAIVGNSMGARIALTMALEQRARIRGLVLLSTRIVASPPSPAQKLLREYTPSRAGMERLVRECFATDPNIVTTELVQDRFEASARPGAHEAMQHVFAGLATAPALDPAALAGFTAPVLLLHGREDRIVPADNGLRLAELLPHADLHLLADTGHWLQIERARTVNTLVADFLTRCLR
jgi:2-hydroxymuconate-semialdehyde hydrolase